MQIPGRELTGALDLVKRTHQETRKNMWQLDYYIGKTRGALNAIRTRLEQQSEAEGEDLPEGGVNTSTLIPVLSE